MVLIATAWMMAGHAVTVGECEENVRWITQQCVPTRIVLGEIIAVSPPKTIAWAREEESDRVMIQVSLYSPPPTSPEG